MVVLPFATAVMRNSYGLHMKVIVGTP